MNDRPCGHEPCTCVVTGESKYCSDFCVAAAGGRKETELRCTCGHTGCEEKKPNQSG